MSAEVALEASDGVGTIRLDRPPLNVLTAAVQESLIRVARVAQEREDIRAVVLYGGERALAAGADIAEMAAMSEERMQEHSRVLQAFTTAIARIDKPVVAAVAGHALGGGCELALAADVRFAQAGARLGLPEITLGIIPGAGGTQRLARLVGPARAKQLIFTGRILTAEQAREIGLVDVVVPDDVYAAAREWAAAFATGPRRALAAAKRAVDRGLDVALEEGLEIERTEFAALFGTEDSRIGMNAFLAKSRPDFVGR